MSQGTDTTRAELSRREERAHRILDAASTLILRWGYNKTTVDDIARQAGVAKGTIYLHWKTRDDLFDALMLREKLAMAEDLRERITTDPEGLTLRGVFKHSALALMNSPLLKASLLSDTDIIGKLAHSRSHTGSYAERLATFKIYLELLRENGLVRTDQDMDEQVYILSAIFMGFFLVVPLVPEHFTFSEEKMAELLSETIHRTLESDVPYQPELLQSVSNTFTHFMDISIERARKQLQQEIEG